MGPTGIGPVFGIVSPIAVQTEKGVNGDLGPIIPVKAELRQKEAKAGNTNNQESNRDSPGRKF